MVVVNDVPSRFTISPISCLSAASLPNDSYYSHRLELSLAVLYLTADAVLDVNGGKTIILAAFEGEKDFFSVSTWSQHEDRG